MSTFRISVYFPKSSFSLLRVCACEPQTSISRNDAKSEMRKTLRVSDVPMPHRVFTVLCRLSAHVGDQETVQSFYRVRGRACVPRDPAYSYADGGSLEVHASSISADEDAFLRREVFGAKP